MPAKTAELLKAFHVCDAAGLGPDRPSEYFAYALEGIPQGDYPYPIGNMPAWPVNATCKIMVDAYKATFSRTEKDTKRLIAAAAAVTDMAFGYDGKTCIPTFVEGPGGVPGDGPG